LDGQIKYSLYLKKKRKNRDRYSPGVGGYSGFQVLGMIERFFLGGGFEMLDSGIFLGRKIWQVHFWVADLTDFWGYSKQS